METVIRIKTTRYSRVIRAIVDAYKDDAIVMIGSGKFGPRESREYSGPEIDSLMSWWCTNQSIIDTLDFSLIRDGVTLFGFHDHPSELWAAPSEQEFVDQLVHERLARVLNPQIHRHHKTGSWLGCLNVTGVMLITVLVVLWLLC